MTPVRASIAFFVLALVVVLRADPPAAADLDRTFGIALWAGESGGLWQADAETLARRLGWPVESRTSRTSSHRLYASEDVRVLGARPYSLSFTARDGHPEGFSFIFANKGDVEGLNSRRAPGDADAARSHRRALRDYRKAIRSDAETIAANLTSLLGPPAADQVGSGPRLREAAKRWDWQGHAILLTSVRDGYTAVRILPSSDLDNLGTERLSDRELRETLAARVLRRPGGDVVLQDLPMVDQGPKGFCVPATVERTLRYLGLPADMYLLAVAGGTEAGGGTRISDILAAIDPLVRRHGRRILRESGGITLDRVARQVDAGLPILWALNTSAAIDEAISRRTAERTATGDSQAWLKVLERERRTIPALARRADEAHVCLITGYNRTTGEIAISDSWGPGYEERWITASEAAALSQGDSVVISW